MRGLVCGARPPKFCRRELARDGVGESPQQIRLSVLLYP
jgi:hypothetical protein